MQLRMRTCVPPPHDTVQVPQAPQLDKPPSTETHNYIIVSPADLFKDTYEYG